MMIESISIASVYGTIGTCPLHVAVVAWVWLEAGSVDFSKSSGPPSSVTVSLKSDMHLC